MHTTILYFQLQLSKNRDTINLGYIYNLLYYYLKLNTTMVIIEE